MRNPTGEDAWARPHGHFMLLVLGLVAAILTFQGGKLAAATTILMGISPYGDANIIVANHDPLAQYLAHRGYKTELLTAPDTTVFFERAQKDAYDLALVSGHIAASLVKETIYKPLVRFDIGTLPTVYVTQDSSLHTLQDLRGKALALSNPIDYTSMAMKVELEERGFNTQTGLHLSYAKNHYSAVLLLLANQVDAVVTLPQTIERLQPRQSASLRTLTTFGSSPPIYFVGASHLGTTVLADLQTHLLAFHRGQREHNAPSAFWYAAVAAVDPEKAVPSSPTIQALLNKLPASISPNQ